LLARLGLLEDAPPLFGSATAIRVPEFSWRCRVGRPAAFSIARSKSTATLARPFMAAHQLATLLLMALWRINARRSQGIFTQDLGRVLG